VTLELRVDGEQRRVEPDVLIVVGYTGADSDTVRHHIDELAAEGIPPPPQVPMYWAKPASSMTQAPAIDVPSRATSGEIELAIVVDGADRLLAAGSDHTCREAEAIDIRLSKLICQTPISVDALRWDDVADRWDELMLASTIPDEAGEPVVYQSATAGVNRGPLELVERIPWGDDRPASFVVLCGTVPVIGGIRPAARFDGTVTDPRSGQRIELGYTVRSAPALAVGPLG